MGRDCAMQRAHGAGELNEWSCAVFFSCFHVIVGLDEHKVGACRHSQDGSDKGAEGAHQVVPCQATPLVSIDERLGTWTVACTGVRARGCAVADIAVS